MRKIDQIKTLPWTFMIIMALTLSGCADDAAHDSEEKTQQTQMTEQENEDNSQKKQDIPPQAVETGSVTGAETGSGHTAETENQADIGPEAESASDTKNQTETGKITDPYEPVPVTQMDYDSFRSQMTKEEWESFQQYFPVLKENAAFELTPDKYYNYTMLDKDGEITTDETNVVFYRYDFHEATDLSRYAKTCEDRGITEPDEMMIYEVQVFDLDRDGIQELILYWGSAGNVLVFHYEDGKFYGWETVYRGFEVLQTSGVYIASGGAAYNDCRQIRFEQETWIAEILASVEGDKYFIGGEEINETAYQQNISSYKTGDVTTYKPKQYTGKP